MKCASPEVVLGTGSIACWLGSRRTKGASRLLLAAVKLVLFLSLASAWAIAQSPVPACLYALDGSAQGALSISGSTSISTSCSVVVESTGSEAFEMSGTEILYVQNNVQVGVVGGWSLTGQTKIENQSTGQTVQPVKISSPGDPLSFLPAPTTGNIVGKTHTSYDMNNKPPNDTLSPGVYCGGLTIGNTNGATFTMSPGTYIMAGGGLTINSLAVVSGSGVTVYNTSSSSSNWGCSGSSSYTPITLSGQVNVTLSAPTSGSLANVVMFGDRAGCSKVGSCEDQINGGSTTTLNGALYFKSDTLLISGNNSSKGCGMVVADMIIFNGNSSVMNSCSGAIGGVTVSVTPATAALYAGQTQQFSATVTNTSNTAVTWSISPSGVGTISASGLYTAPSTITSSQTVTVTATSQAESTVTGTATITLALPPSITASLSPSPNAAGWNNSTVTVTFTCTTGTYPVKTCPSPVQVTTQGANQQFCGQAVDTNGDKSTSVCANVSLDETPPTITATPTPAADSQGWNNTDVTVNFTCSDSLSGISVCPSPILVSAAGANQVISGTATDKAGNTAKGSTTLNVELTLPSITAAVSPAPNSNYWNNTNVTVTFTCTQATAPITSCPSPQVVSTQGANQVITGTVTDAANNTNTAKVTLNIGKTPPTITASISPAPNSAGWNNSSVTVSFTCTAGVAPLATCPSPQTVSTQGANQVITGTATDIAGNSASASATVNLATTPPTITAVASPAANAAGWNNTSVTVTFTCTVTKAPIASCPQPQTVSSQGANQVVSGTVTDVAGNTATTTIKVSIATTPPTITASLSPVPDAQGWNNTPVMITYTCTGTIAPVVTCPSQQVISTNGANQAITGTVTDAAGNSASTTVTLNIGTAPPVVTGAISPAPNAAGWNNSSVTVSFTCTPGTAPIAVAPGPVTISTPGANQLAKGVCTDVAGNSATASVLVNIDTTPPTITASASPAPNAAGWNTSSVTVTFLCTDALSGIASCTSPQVISTAGAGQVVKGSATDVAGNTASAQITLNISKTPPTIIATPSPAPNAAGWNNTNVTVTFICTPGGAPITSCPLPQVVSTEGSAIPVSGTVTDAAGATATATVVIKLDKTPPTITTSLSPAPNSSGWDTSPVTVSFTCSDSLSGVATCPGPSTVSTNGANQTVSGTAVDVAGNSAVASATVNLEQTLPTISASLSPTANSAGWNDTAVTVSFSCSQSASSIVSCGPTQTVSTQGTGEVVTGTVVDQAGNQNTATVALNIDETPPVISQFTAPSQLSPGQSGTATVTTTDIAPIASVVFELGGSPIGTASSPPYSISVTAPSNATSGSTLTLTAVVTDVAGNTTSANKGIQVASAGVLVGEVLTDTTGLPLQGATLQVLGQSSETATSDTNGQYSIPVTGSQLFLDISEPGASDGVPNMMTVERQVTVQSGVGTVPIDARMTPLAAPVVITASGGTVGTGAITVTVPAGGATISYYLTPLSQQGLPGLLPLGWSSVAAFDLQTNVSTSAALSANFTGLPTGTLYLVSYSYAVHAWSMVTPNLTTANGSLTVSLPSTGDYALVMQDPGTPIPPTGQPLTGVSMVTLPTSATSTGSLNPANVAASGGTSTASLAVQSTTALPSGTVIQAQVTETYTLTSGQALSEAARYEDLLLFQNPAPPTGSVVGASFPVTPSQTFQPAQLSSGDVHLNILSGRESVRGQTGGSDPVSVQSGDATLTVAAGSLSQDTAVAVTPESVDTFLPSTATLVPVSEYNVNFSDQTLTNPAQLSVGTQGLAPGTNVVIAQEDRIAGVPYLVVVSLATVTTTNIVSTPTPGLPGITQGGNYVFYELTIPTGFVSGTISASSGPVAAMVQTDALPFVAFSASNGTYDVVAAAGTVNLTASIANTAMAGTASAQVTSGQTATANISVAGQVEAATITPANGALGVSLTPEIDITATEGFNPASATPSTVVLTAAGSSTPIALTFVFSSANTRLAIFPQSALQPSTQYTLQANGLANAVAGLVSVPTISFTTLSVTAPTYSLTSLVFAMPDSNGNVAVSAVAGSFPAASTILIVDQTNGVVYTLTVLNDGSVSGSMPATINDVLQVTLTDPSGNVSNLTVGQFVSSTGSVAVNSAGGTVTGPGGLSMIIPPNALTQGAVFQIQSLPQSAFPQLPTWTGANFGSGMQITASSTPSFNQEVKLGFPVPANAPSGAFYYVYRQMTDQNNNVYFETIDEAFVQGTGASAQVVTASPPFCGYRNSYGNFQNTAAAIFIPQVNAVVQTFLMWAVDPNQPGVSSQGLIVGNIFQTVTTSGQTTIAPYTGQATLQLINSQGKTSGVAIWNSACGTFTIFDPQLGGGTRTVQASIGTQTLQATTTEVNGIQVNDADYNITSGLEAFYYNIGRVNFTLPPAALPPPPPQINVTIINANTGQPITGIVPSGTPLTIDFSSSLTLQSVSINGSECDGVACPTFSGVAPPANAPPNLNYYQLNTTYSPSNAGPYSISVTGINPLMPTATPVTVSQGFLVVESGGSNNTLTASAPIVISSTPLSNATGVSPQIFPEIVFSEPVTNVPPPSITLMGSAGDTPTMNLIGIRADGSVANPVMPGDSITSLTIQPTSGLQFNDTYTLTLSSGIVDAMNRSLAAPNTLTFTTYQPYQIGSTSNSITALTRPVVIGSAAYVGALVGNSGVTSGPDVINISDPANPQNYGITTSFVGRVTDAAGQQNSPVVGGPNGGILALSASFAEDDFLPSNIWLYSVNGANPTQINRVGAVSATSSATQAGVALRLSVLDNYLYASTFLQGLQVINLPQALSEYTYYQQNNPTQFAQAVSTDGDGFAMDTIVNTIPLPLAVQNATATATEFDLKAAYFTTNTPGGGPSQQPLIVATGRFPLVVADPFAGTNGVLYPGYTSSSPTATVNDVPLQMTATNGAVYSLVNGVAVDVGTIPYTKNGVTSNKTIAVLVGSGTVSGAAASLLAVVDISQPYVPGSTPPYTLASPYLPQAIGFFQLSSGPTDVILDGTNALVGTGSNVLIVDLTNPYQPVSGGTIVGSYGSRLALDGNGVLIAAGNIPVQTINLGPLCEGYREQIENGNTGTNITYPLNNLDWTINSGSFSDIGSPLGFVLNGISLGPRTMANQMSLNYVVVNRNANGTTSTPAPLTCSVYGGAPNSAGACTNSPTSRSQLLQFQYINTDPNHFELEAQYLIDRLDGNPDDTPDVPDSCLVVTQDYQFWKEGYDACEASDALSCARFKPIASYQYYTDTGPTINTVNMGQQFQFNPTQTFSNGQYPQSSSSIAMLMYDCEHTAAGYLAAVAYGNNQAIKEGYANCTASQITGHQGPDPLADAVAMRVIQNGQGAPITNPTPPMSNNPSLQFLRADNMHLQATEGHSIMGPQTNGNPGCPECVHIHWRWGQLLEANDPLGALVVSPRFNNNNGNAMIPPGSNQDVDIAIDYLINGETTLDPSGLLWSNPPEPISEGNTGSPLAFWYAGTGHSSGDSFFTHGGFFSSQRASIGNPSIAYLSILNPLPIPVQSYPCPSAIITIGLCPVTSPITNNTGHTLQWTATFTDLSYNPVVGGIASNPTTGTITSSSGTAIISLPGGIVSSQTLILSIQVTDLTTNWTTQRQAYVTAP